LSFVEKVDHDFKCEDADNGCYSKSDKERQKANGDFAAETINFNCL